MNCARFIEILILFIFLSSVSLLICHCEAFDQQQTATSHLPNQVTTIPTMYAREQSENSESNLSITNIIPNSSIELSVYFTQLKSEYTGGEPIIISGYTNSTAGKQMYIEIATMEYHQRRLPEGKTNMYTKTLDMQSGMNFNFSLTLNSTLLLPGEYYVVVFFIDKYTHEAVLINKTTFTLHDPVVTQSGEAIFITFSLAIIAICLVLFRKK